jgi:hypothetical protein
MKRSGTVRKPGALKRVVTLRTAASAAARPAATVSRVVPLAVERTASKRFISERTARCPKCDSTFIGHEPAFVHCHYCGNMARITDAPLLAQELFEIRSGLRLAS